MMAPDNFGHDPWSGSQPDPISALHDGQGHGGDEAYSSERAAPAFSLPPAAGAVLLAGDPVVYHACQLELAGRPVLFHLVECLRRAGIRRIEIMTPPGDVELPALVEAAGSQLPPLVLTGQHEAGAPDGLLETRSYPNPDGLLVFEANRLFHPSALMRIARDARPNLLLAEFSGALPERAVRLQVDADHRILRYSSELPALLAHGISLGVFKIGDSLFDKVRQMLRRERPPRLSELYSHLFELEPFHAVVADACPRLRVRGRLDLEGALDRLPFLTESAPAR